MGELTPAEWATRSRRSSQDDGGEILRVLKGGISVGEANSVERIETTASADARLFDLILTATIWFVGLALATGTENTAMWIPFAAVGAGVASSVLTSIPLSPWATGLRRTASARRITEASTAATAAALLPALVMQTGVAAWVVLCLFATTWVTLAITAALSPLGLSAEAPATTTSGDARHATRLERSIKRAMDITGALIVLTLTSPILLISAFLIWKHDRGPVFFRQPRVAQGGGSFEIYKFRSMVIDADSQKDSLRGRNERTGPLFKLSDDPRITPIGKTIRDLSIDELPQLINVLRGEMSMVGPRPALIDEAGKFDEELASMRAHVRPGITGLWQAEARSDPDFARYRSLDLYYVRNWSLGLDSRIILATVAEVLAAVAAVPLKRLGLVDKVSADAISHNADDEALIDGSTVLDLRADADADVIDLNAYKSASAENSANETGVSSDIDITGEFRLAD